MAVLSSKRRSKMRKTTFALPKGVGPDKSRNQYPIPDMSHAANAKSRAKQQLKRGKLTRSQYQTVVRKANKKLKGK